jgi:hypothetical protein
VRRESANRKQPARKPPDKESVAFNLGPDVPPLDTPEFRRRLGQTIANAARPHWMRDEPRKPPKRH